MIEENFNKEEYDICLFKTSKLNDWKYEYTVSINKEKRIRFKIYGKTEDKLTSTGANETDTKDPRSELLLTPNKQKHKYNRWLLHINGFAVSRIEFSFYADILKTPEFYNNIMERFFIGGKNIIDCKMFR